MLLGQLESEAQTDPKTSLGRVDWWRRRTEEMLRTARTQREPIAVLLIDIDHFKLVNDRHGHLVGDEALRAVATILRSAIRAKDVIGRFGGEEFVIALPDTDLADATVTADRLRSAVAASPLAAMCAGVLDDPDLDPDTFRLTVSIGVAVYPSDGQTVDDLLLPRRPRHVRRQSRRPRPGPPGRRRPHPSSGPSRPRQNRPPEQPPAQLTPRAGQNLLAGWGVIQRGRDDGRGMQRSESRDEDFTAFVLARSARLVHIARMLCGDPVLAEDLVQTALEKAYLRWERIELGDPFGYVRQAVVNQHLSWVRRRPWRERPSGDAAEVDQRFGLSVR